MKLTFWIVLCAGIGGILYGYDLSVFSGSIYLIQNQLHLTIKQISLAGGAVFMGGLIGTMLTGYLSDQFGRRAMIIAGSICFILGILITINIQSFDEFFFSRVVLGIAIGVVSVSVPSYLSEIAPTPIRGRSVTIFQLFLTGGILIAYIANSLFLPSGNWKILYILVILPSLILGVSMFYLPESPRWLMSKERATQALKILQLTRPEDEALADLEGMKLAHEMDQKSRWQDLLSRHTRRSFFVVLLVAILNQLTAINSILIYAPAIFKAAGMTGTQNAVDASILIGLVNFLSTVMSMFIVDKLGRRSLLFFGTMGMTLAYICLALITHLALDPLYAVIGMMVFIFCFAVGPGPIVWLILTELLPTGVRGKGLAVALFVNSLTSWAIASLFLQIKTDIGIGHTYLIFAFFTFCYFIVTWTLIPETKQRSLEQIQDDFTTNHPSHHTYKGRSS